MLKLKLDSEKSGSKNVGMFLSADSSMIYMFSFDSNMF